MSSATSLDPISRQVLQNLFRPFKLRHGWVRNTFSADEREGAAVRYSFFVHSAAACCKSGGWADAVFVLEPEPQKFPGSFSWRSGFPAASTGEPFPLQDPLSG